MGFIVIGRAEIDTTDLAEAAFYGKTDLILENIKNGIDWKSEGSELLEGAIYGAHLELVQKILDAGSPLRDSTYYIAYNYFAAALKLLPPNEELIKTIKAKNRPSAFAWALTDENIPLSRQLLSEGVSIDTPVLISYGMGNVPPIHYAIRKANLELMQLVLDAGANPNFLNDKGQSPLRIIAENILLTKAERKQAIRLMQAYGGQCIPEAKPFEMKMLEWFGWGIEEKSYDPIKV